MVRSVVKTESEVESDDERVKDVFRFHAKHQEWGSARIHQPLECGLRSHYAGFVPLPFRAENCGQKKDGHIRPNLDNCVNTGREKQNKM